MFINLCIKYVLHCLIVAFMLIFKSFIILIYCSCCPKSLVWLWCCCCLHWLCVGNLPFHGLSACWFNIKLTSKQSSSLRYMHVIPHINLTSHGAFYPTLYLHAPNFGNNGHLSIIYLSCVSTPLSHLLYVVLLQLPYYKQVKLALKCSGNYFMAFAQIWALISSRFFCNNFLNFV